MSDQGSWNALLSHPEKVACHPDRIPDVGYPEKMERHPGDRPRVHGVGTHPEQLHPDSPRGHMARSPIRTPSGRSTRHSRSSHPDDSISYLDMLSGWKGQPATTYVLPLSDGVSRRSVLAMDSKELSSILDCFGDQKAIKTPKLNTIWLELLARVLNMLIGLKGDNYYSKVFKRVNYKLWNSNFWVVINHLRPHNYRFLVTNFLFFGTIRLEFVIQLRINTLFEDFSITYVLFTLTLRVVWGNFFENRLFICSAFVSIAFIINTCIEHP